MKKVINGMRYNTATAVLLADWSNGKGINRFDVHFVDNALYRTAKGAYFLHVTGGAFTDYAERRSGGSTSGETIVPMSEEEAKRWSDQARRDY